MRFMSRHRRQRTHKVIALLACLLFQQVAMAAAMCTLPMLPVAPMAENCTGMDMAGGPQAQPLCDALCSSDPVLLPEDDFLHIPPVALPPLHFAVDVTAIPVRETLVASVALKRSDRPPRIRYCTLLI